MDMKSIIKKYLEINKYQHEYASFENLFLSHPNYPSLYAVTDTLDMLQVENVAAQVPKEQFSALPDSFLAVVSNDIVLVRRLSQEVNIETEKEGKKKLSFDTFLTQWSGVVVAIEPNEVIQKERLPLLNNGYIGLGILLLALFGLTFREFSFPSLLTFLCSSIGFILSVVIIDEKINKTEGVISKICSFNEHTSCDSVIKSESSRLTKWLDFSDLPILFFGTSIVLLQLAPASYTIVNFVVAYGGLFDLVTKSEIREMVCVVFRYFPIVGLTIFTFCWFYQRFFIQLFSIGSSKCDSIFSLVFYKAYFISKNCSREGECYFIEVQA